MTLELLLLLERVLDLEWRLPLLAPSKLPLAADKLMLGDFLRYSSVETLEEDSDLCCDPSLRLILLSLLVEIIEFVDITDGCLDS